MEIEETTVADLEISEFKPKSSEHQKAVVSRQTKEAADGEVIFGSFDADAWCTASDGWKIFEGNGSNMWAPDIIYNTSMNKYCMYLSLNGEYQNSVVILLTSSNLEGPYAYEGPVVYSGFSAEEDTPINYKNTDLKYIIGENAALPERYGKISGITLDENQKITAVGTNTWADYWPHAIDPAVFYDDGGKLWMIYGSWSGGIYALELDETTGLRDYTVSYASDFDDEQKEVTSDPYFGKKIAGGHYVSGEGPYIEKIGNYYYLFMSYGFYAPNGGYSMRIFRSENPDGPYVDTKGTSAVFEEFKPNFIADYAPDVAQIDTRGMRLMTYYQWEHMPKGEVAQGHNSAVVDGDRAYVIYHTKFNDGSAAHELRVHELFQNKNGWILASPYAFANDDKLNYNEEPKDVAGVYEIIVGDYSLGYHKESGALNENYKGPLSEILTYALVSDGKITKDGQDAGTWTIENGQAYATLTIDGHNYSGVFAEVTKDAAGIKTMCFTGVDEQTGITLWGAKELGGKAVIADSVANPTYIVPEKVYGSFELPSTGGKDVSLYWKSSNPDLAADDGTVSVLPENDTDVTYTMTMVSGDYYYQKEYIVTIANKNSMTDGKYLVGEAYTDQALTLPDVSRPSMTNPFYISNTAGLELSGGVSIEFDVKHSGNVEVLGALFAFNDKESGKLYFTQGSYLGYNALGGYYDANLNNYTLVLDYIGNAIAESGKETAHVTLNVTATGFEVLIDGKMAYDQTILETDNGSGDLTDYTNVLKWLQESASILCMGYGSWWGEVQANAVISNMKFYINQFDDKAAVDSIIAALKKQIPASTMTDLTLPVEGGFGAVIDWTSSHPEIIAADGTVTAPDRETTVTLTAEVTKGSVTKTATFKVLVKLPITSNAVLKKDLLELKDVAQIDLIDNPFFGKNLDSLIVNYDITFTEGGFKNQVTVTFHYPDGTIKTEVLEKNTKLPQPSSEGEDATGKYTMEWYTDEAKTTLYDFNAIVTEDFHLYGNKKYQSEENENQVTITFHYPDGTIKTEVLEKNTKLPQPSSEGEDATGKYTMEWYTDEAKTTLYDFNAIVTEDFHLYGSKKYQSEENENQVTVTFHYPDGIIKTETIEKNAILKIPEFEEKEDANGKYRITWYADEAKTVLYQFGEAVSEDITLYGKYSYYYEEPGKDENGNDAPIETGIRVERIDDQQYTGTAIKPIITVYDGTKKLTEKTDYKISYTDNKKVSTKEKAAKVTITPCGNYEKASKFYIYFNITQRQLTKENVTINYKPEINVKYDKQKAAVGQTQKITLKYGKITIPAKEYTVTYKKGEETVEKLTDAGTYQLVIKMKDTSSYAGELIYDIVVTDKILTSGLKFKIAAQKYSGIPLTPDVSITYKGKSVTTEDNFDLDYNNNIHAGTASVTLTAKPDSDYCGSKTITFNIIGTAINKAVVDGFHSSVPYTGEAITQEVKLILNKGKTDEKTLQAGTDYEIAYTNNIDSGKAVMTITGKGAFSGIVKKVFTIGKINLQQAGEDVIVAFADSKQPLKIAQDKSGAKPAVIVTYKNIILKQDEDYTITYSGNKAVGANAKVAVKGIGNYTGVRKNALSFEIIQKDISDESITVAAEDLKYAANGRYKAKLSVYDHGVKLSSSEYTVGEVENVTLVKDETGKATQCGTAEVLLTGKKNYNETKKVIVQIRKTLISSAKIKVNGNYYYDNGEQVCPPEDKLEVTIGNNKLISGVDFTIENYSNNTKKGNATVTIKGIGEYGGRKTVKFKILPKWMKRSL